MKILVTGGTGFTGKALVRRMLDRGHTVVALDHQEGYKSQELRDWGVELVIGTVTDKETVRRCMRGVEVVHHVAAAFRELSVPRRHYRDVNVEGTSIVLDAALAEGVRKFVYCSTCGVHGNVDDPPAGEDAPIQPADYYQQTKYEAEPLVSAYLAKGLKTTTLRPAAIYGPGDPGRFYMIFRQLERGWFPMIGDGKVLYHPLYIDNFLDAFELAMDESKGLGQAYLIADEQYRDDRGTRPACSRRDGCRAAFPAPAGLADRGNRPRRGNDLPSIRHRTADSSAARRLVSPDAGIPHRQGSRRARLPATHRSRRRPAPGLRLVSRARHVAVRDGGMKAWLRAIRPHHWAKNTLVLIPAAAAHTLADPVVLTQCALAFAAFSLMASGTYLINDVMDAESDRSHPTKQRRPVANRELTVRSALTGAVLLIGAALAISWFTLAPIFLVVLAGYLALTLWYSFDLKQRAMVDILCLAALYTGRILAGSAATGIDPTFWLLAFSMLLFFSLAAAKRATELGGLASTSERQAPGRGYTVRDLPLLVVFGVVSAYASVLLLALYVNARGGEMYARPMLLWLLCPALLYWVSRIWLKTYRQELHEDPVVFALTDRASLAVAFVCAALLWFAI